MSIDTIELWHKRSRPKPDSCDFNIQLSCHFEEVAEMLADLMVEELHDPLGPRKGSETSLYFMLNSMAYRLRQGDTHATLPAKNRANFAKEMADQVVTAVGVGYCAGMEMEEVVRRVNRSNWSKFDDSGQPVRDETGKITKGPKYAPPDLDGCY